MSEALDDLYNRYRMTTTRLLPVGLVLAQAFCAVRMSAQVGESGAVFFDAVPFAGEVTTSPRLDLFLAVPSTSLDFERDGENLTASYRVRFEVSSGDRRVHDTTLERTTRTRAATQASRRPTYDFFQHRLHLPSGAYTARADVIDPRSTSIASAQRSVMLSPLPASPLSMSGLLLVDRIREDSGGFVITPRMSDVVSSDGEGCFLFFEAYNGPAPLDVLLDARFVNAAGTVADERRFERTLPAGRSQQWIRIEAAGLARGEYTLELRASARVDSTRVLATTNRTLRVVGSGGLPSGEAELAERIEQLRHVASQEEIEEINAAPDVREKRRRYAGLWSRLDPTPGTPRNEAMEEYLSRIDFAKEHFRSYAAGWMTDQGRVYVLYGAPDRIARDPFRGDSRRIETWHYYARGNLELSFEDESGFGDFRLLTPISPLEKYRYGGY